LGGLADERYEHGLHVFEEERDEDVGPNEKNVHFSISSTTIDKDKYPRIGSLNRL